ncbi:MAG: acetyl-CoA carboxylase carboxyltransferase subunit alpha [Verrucomicrobia bacterium]|nr:acetyl-CoA carboxylase carboxyltransferase subunit alpha [Verrucomicrobiota bacterium]
MLAHEKEIAEYEKTLKLLKEQNQTNALWSEEEFIHFETKLDSLKNKVYSQLTPWDRVAISRHPARPKSLDFIRGICEEFTEVCGDRLFSDDHAIIAGLARIGGQKFMIVAQEKGSDTETRLHRNFGMMHPEGYRKAMRCMELAAKFNIPVLSLLDTPGAYPGLSAEERGQGWAIAHNMWAMSRLPTPVIVILIGEGCSGGAIGMGVGDVVAMLEHAYYSVISPEGCASILWKDTAKNQTAAEALKIHAEEMISFGIVDDMIPEPLGGAHLDPAFVYKGVKEFVLQKWDLLKEIPLDALIERRYQKFRKLGEFVVEEKGSLL